MEMETLEKESWSKEDVDAIKTELSNKHLRLYAEFENYKKRVSKEKDDIRNLTKVETLSTILDVDNDISIAISKMESKNEGMNLILSKIDNFLKSQDIQSIPTDKYNEDIHEVISIVPTTGAKSGEIVEVVSKGYTLNGKIVRYPKVILAK